MSYYNGWNLTGESHKKGDNMKMKEELSPETTADVMDLHELIENELGNTHDNPNIDNDYVAEVMTKYANHCVKKERNRIMVRLKEMFNKESIKFLDDFIIDLMNDN